MSEVHVPFPDKRYSIILADPAWSYRGTEALQGPSAKETYPCVPTKDLKQWPVAEKLAEKDCMLFLWVVSPMLDDGIDVGKAWGFKYSTVAFVWDKQLINPGHYTLSQVELCLCFRRGTIPQPRGARNVRQFLSEKRTKHSAKPNEVRERIHRMFPELAKLEMFARDTHHAFDAWGNEVAPRSSSSA
jgi:N6-adenosine-specific RNA methylase IME4